MDQITDAPDVRRPRTNKWNGPRSFAGETFKTKKALYARLKAIKDANTIGEPIGGRDADLLSEVFVEANRIYEYEEAVPVRWTTALDGYRCVQFNVYVEGSNEPWAPAIKRLSQEVSLDPEDRHRRRVRDAFRQAVVDQVQAYKRAYFEAQGDFPTCELTGVLIEWRTCDVDHFPVRFADLMADFLVRSGVRDLADVPLDEGVHYANGGQTPLYALGNGLEEPWRAYHARSATLRVVSKDAHKHRTRFAGK